MSNDKMTLLGGSHPNRFLERFKIIRGIGRGAMGEVLLAEDTQLSRQVAIKTIRAAGSLDLDLEANLQNRFRNEAGAGASLSHPNVVTIFDYAVEDGTQYIVMEYVDGTPLSKLIQNDNAIEVQDVFQILNSICEGVQAIHRAGTIHRDLKPSNIICGTQEGVVKIIDLGIARLEGSDMTRTGMILGTLNYMSPEQAQGQQVTRASDIFSIGCIAYELLTREKAFPGRSATSVLYRIANEAPVSPSKLDPTLPEFWDGFVARCLKKGPDERFQDCDEILSFLAENDSSREDRPSGGSGIWSEIQQERQARAVKTAADATLDSPWMTGEVYWASSILTLGMSSLTIPYLLLRNFAAALTEQFEKDKELERPDFSRSFGGWSIIQVFGSWGLSALGLFALVVFVVLFSRVDFTYAAATIVRVSALDIRNWLIAGQAILFSGWLLLLLWLYHTSKRLDQDLMSLRADTSQNDTRARSQIFGQIYYVIMESGVVMLGTVVIISAMFQYQIDTFLRRVAGGSAWAFDAFYLLELISLPSIAILLIYFVHGYVRYVTRALLVRVVVDDELGLSWKLAFGLSRIFCCVLIFIAPFYLHRRGLLTGIEMLIR